MYPTDLSANVSRPQHQPVRAMRGAPKAALTAIALAGVLIAAVALVAHRPAQTAIAPGDVAAHGLVDGWGAYLGAAATKQQPTLVDGWSTYLLADPASEVPVDGWSSYLLVDEPDPVTLVDGWITRYGSRDD